MKRAPRRRLDVDERREEILQAARQLFVEKPYDEVSVDEIAARANASKALIYHYYDGKRGLYTETIRRAAAELLQNVAPDPSWPPETRLARGLHAYLDHVQRAGPGYIALMRGGIGADPEIFSIVESTRQAICDRAIAAMGFTTPPRLLKLAMRAWIGFVEAAAVTWLLSPTVTRDVLVALLSRAATATIEYALKNEP